MHPGQRDDAADALLESYSIQQHFEVPCLTSLSWKIKPVLMARANFLSLDVQANAFAMLCQAIFILAVPKPAEILFSQ